MTTLLVLGAGPAQLGAYAAARRLRIETVGCDRDERAFCLRLGLVDRFVPVSAMDRAAVVELARSTGASGVIAPGTAGPVLVAAQVCAELGLPHPLTPEVAARATDKLAQRAAFAAAGVPQPEWSEHPLAGRSVVKPSQAQGQRGLALVDGDPSEALAAARHASRDGRALCERLVDGPELTVSGLVTAAGLVPLIVADRERTAGFGVATAHVVPASTPTADVAVAACSAVAALGIASGPAYVQVVDGPDGPRVMEVAARLGGGHDGELCAATTGIDLSELAVLAALGERIEVPSAGRRLAGAVRFLLAGRGTLVRVEGLERARALGGVVLAHVYREPGTVFGPVTTGADRAGFVLATGETRAAALAVAARASDAIRLRTDIGSIV